MGGSLLPREELIEQAYFFRAYRERLDDNVPSQDILSGIQDEVLATTRLPLAIDFLRGEMLLNGRMSEGMARLPHYFTPFQAFVIERAEDDHSRFDQRIALKILEREAEYRAGSLNPAGLFIYQFECISRNTLGYDRGMQAMALDPVYDESWRDWILKTRLQLGTIEFADMIYLRSELYAEEERRRNPRPDIQSPFPVLFGLREGRIARANRGKDPLYMFAALQRQLGYPKIPRTVVKQREAIFHPALEQRLQRLEKRMSLLENETKGQLDLSEFYVKPPKFDDEPK